MRCKIALLTIFLCLIAAMSAESIPYSRSVGEYQRLLHDYHSFSTTKPGKGSRGFRVADYISLRDTSNTVMNSRASIYWRELAETDVYAAAQDFRYAFSSELEYVFELDEVTLGSASGRKAGLTIGKQLMPNLILRYRIDFRSKRNSAFDNDGISLEYVLTDRLSVIVQQGGVANTGVDLLVRWRK